MARNKALTAAALETGPTGREVKEPAKASSLAWSQSSRSRKYQRHLPPLHQLARRGALAGDPKRTDVLLDAAADWWKAWMAVNCPGHVAPAFPRTLPIDDNSVWIRADQRAQKAAIAVKSNWAPALRDRMGRQAKVLDLIVCLNMTVEQAAHEIFGNDKKLSKEKIRDRLSEALHEVANAQRLWGT